MSKSLRIVGRIHPPAASNSVREPDDLSAAEIRMYSSRGLNSANDASRSMPILIEHEGGAVGSVLASWQADDGSLKMAASISDPEAKRMVASGQMRGLSIGSSLHHKGSSAEAKLLQTLDEVSVCEKPRRAGCWIESIAEGVGPHKTVCTPMYASQKKYPRGVSPLCVAPLAPSRPLSPPLAPSPSRLAFYRGILQTLPL